MEDWAEGSFNYETSEETAVANAAATASAKTLKDIYELDFEQLVEGLTDE